MSTIFGGPVGAWGDPREDDGGEDACSGEDSAGSPSSRVDTSQWADTSRRVARFVEIGYRVANENIRCGQEVARQMNKRSPYGSGRGMADFQDATQRFWCQASDMAYQWFDMWSSIALGQGWMRPGDAKDDPDCDDPDRVEVGVDMESWRPTKTDICLDAGCSPRDLHVEELRAQDANIPPIKDVTFERGDRNDLVRVRIRIAEDVVPAEYRGTIRDRYDVSRGTLTVRVL